MLSVGFSSTGPVWCGLTIDWGDGIKQDVRVGDDSVKMSPFFITHAYSRPGELVINLQGKSLLRGLRSAQACSVFTAPLKVVVFDAAVEERALGQQEEIRAAQERQRLQEEAQRLSRDAQERERSAISDAERVRKEVEAQQAGLRSQELDLRRRELELKEATLKRDMELQQAVIRERELELKRKELDLKRKELELKDAAPGQDAGQQRGVSTGPSPTTKPAPARPASPAVTAQDAAFARRRCLEVGFPVGTTGHDDCVKQYLKSVGSAFGGG